MNEAIAGCSQQCAEFHPGSYETDPNIASCAAYAKFYIDTLASGVINDSCDLLKIFNELNLTPGQVTGVLQKLAVDYARTVHPAGPQTAYDTDSGLISTIYDLPGSGHLVIVDEGFEMSGPAENVILLPSALQRRFITMRQVARETAE